MPSELKVAEFRTPTSTGYIAVLEETLKPGKYIAVSESLYKKLPTVYTKTTSGTSGLTRVIAGEKQVTKRILGIFAKGERKAYVGVEQKIISGSLTLKQLVKQGIRSISFTPRVYFKPVTGAIVGGLSGFAAKGTIMAVQKIGSKPEVRLPPITIPLPSVFIKPPKPDIIERTVYKQTGEIDRGIDVTTIPTVSTTVENKPVFKPDIDTMVVTTPDVDITEKTVFEQTQTQRQAPIPKLTPSLETPSTVETHPSNFEIPKPPPLFLFSEERKRRKKPVFEPVHEVYQFREFDVGSIYKDIGKVRIKL